MKPPEFTRTYPEISYLLERGKSMLVLGPRGTGKTYCLTRLLAELPHTSIVDLLNREYFARYLRDPGLIYREVESQLASDGERLVVMIDEVQLLPQLLNEVHRAIEAFKPRLQFVLTGSSARKLKQSDANLLAGRAIKIQFFPLGLDELPDYGLPKLLQWGTLPETLTTGEEDIRASYLDTYVGTYLDEEVKKEAQVRNLEGFARFLELAAVDNGQCINYSKISRAAGIADVTVKEYFQILVDTLLAYHVPAWSYSLREQLQQSPKYFLFDNGVINALLGELRSTPRASTYRFGRLFENFVLGQIMQQRAKRRAAVGIYHYRSMEGKEIDFIAQKNPTSAPVAIEVKSGNAPSLEDVRQLVEFKRAYPKSSQVVICRTPKAYADEGIEFLPVEEGISRVFELAEQS